jgi:hypothetical protein
MFLGMFFCCFAFYPIMTIFSAIFPRMTVVFERLFLVLLQKFFLLFIIQKTMKGKLLLSDGTEFFGELYGKQISVNGEVVFNTGMTGYEQSLSDPSYRGRS